MKHDHSLNRSFKDNLKNRNNLLNSISSSDYPVRHFNGISFSILHELRKSNPFRVIISHIDLNYGRNKFDPLKEMIKYIKYILLVSETKLDDTCPVR